MAKWSDDISKTRAKVHEFLGRVDRDPALKKSYKDDPDGTLVAAGIGFADASEVKQYRSKDCDAGESCVDKPETNH